MKRATTMHKHISHPILISDSVCILGSEQEKAFEVKQSETPTCYSISHTHLGFKIVIMEPCLFSK